MRESIFEKLILLFFLVLGAICLWATGQIGGVAFDPLGSKALPKAVGILVILLSLFCLFSSFFKGTEVEEPDRIDLKTLFEVFVVLVLALVYVSCLFIYRIPFSLMTCLLIPSVAYVLQGEFNKRMMLIALITGVIIGFGGEFLFTKVFFVDLPKLV